MNGAAPSTQRREHRVIEAFVRLSHELVDDYDVTDLLSTLTGSCVDLLDVSSAGLLLADHQGVLHLVASSSETTHHLEVFQLQRNEGPCLDCFASGERVTVTGHADMARRWPEFARAAELLGFETVHAVPMRLRDQVLGALGLFGTDAGQLDDADIALAQALVHVACVAIVNEESASDRTLVNAQLQRALSSRVVLEQAKGVISAAANLEMETAFTVLRRYARDHGARLADVADDVVHRRLHHDSLLAHARATAVLPT